MWLRVLLLLLLLIFLLPAVLAQQPKGPANMAKLLRVPNPNDAQAAALLDLSTRPVLEQPFYRYLWVVNGDTQRAQVLSLILNENGRGTQILRPEPFGVGKLLLLRVDLRHYAPRLNDFKEWVQAWEDLQFEPAFNLLITKDILKQVAQGLKHWKGRGWVYRWTKRLQDVPEYTYKGKTFNRKWVYTPKIGPETFTLADLAKAPEDIELIRIPAPYLDQKIRTELEARTQSQAPLLTDGYFTFRATSTIQDKGLYSIVYGGRYYQFTGIRKAKQKGLTDEDQLFEDIGVVDKGTKAEDLFERLRSDMRAAIFRSEVTGSPRRMDFFRSRGGRLDVTSGLVSITHDIANQDVDIGSHPIMNLLKFKDKAREIIWERQNGLHGYALIKAEDGSLQDEVPPDVAKDHTIPPPHTSRLQGSISCKACHEAEGSDGWKLVTNDVKKLVGAQRKNKKLNLFGDVSRANDAIADTLDRLAGLYEGDPERALMRGRDDYALAVLKATGPWKDLKGQTKIVKAASGKLVEMWRDHWYTQVDAFRALHELGIQSDPKEAVKILSTLLRPDLRAAVPIPEINDAIIPEDPRIGALLAGLKLNRWEWDFVRAFAAERAQHRLTTLEKGMRP